MNPVSCIRLDRVPALRFPWRLLPLLYALALGGVARAESMAQAFDAALRSDGRLAASALQLAAAESALAATRGLARPQVAVDGLYSHLSEGPAFKVQLSPLPPMALPFAQQDTAALRAGVTLPVYTGGRLSSAAAAADSARAAAATEQERTRQDIKLAMAEAYVAVLRGRRLLALADSGVASLLAHQRDVENFLAQGLVARVDALAARAALANAQQDRLRAASATDLAEAAYNRQLGRPQGSAVSLDEPAALQDGAADADADADADALALATAPAERAELTGLARQTDALRHQADAARAAARPQLVLSAGYDRVNNRYLVHEGQWVVGVGLHWSLFDGGTSRAQADSLAARAQAVAALRDDLASQLALQVHGATLQVQESRQRIALAAEAVAQADENLRVARDRYQSGVGTHTEVLDAEALRLKSHSNRFNAVYDHLLATQRLQRARGTL